MADESLIANIWYEPEYGTFAAYAYQPNVPGSWRVSGALSLAGALRELADAYDMEEPTHVDVIK